MRCVNVCAFGAGITGLMDDSYYTMIIRSCFFLLFVPGELVDKVSQLISTLVPVQADWLATLTSCAVQ